MSHLVIVLCCCILPERPWGQVRFLIAVPSVAGGININNAGIYNFVMTREVLIAFFLEAVTPLYHRLKLLTKQSNKEHNFYNNRFAPIKR